MTASVAEKSDVFRFDGKLEKAYEPSRIRRGRLATSPTWYVTFPDGQRWRFHRKKDAASFIDRGGICVLHDPWLCRECGGTVVAK